MELLTARERMIHELHQSLDADEHQFLLSFVANRPEWHLLKLEHLEHLPGIRWKQQNLEPPQKRNAKKFGDQSDTRALLLT